ncbi:MAG: DNA methyltransferase [Ignavibacteria bacterium]|nr:DNA methyltransferase [Ignavibacteria bacterium]
MDGQVKPYFQDDAVTIYLGDCRDILPQLTEKVDLVLTDPPYGIGAGREKPHNGWRDYGISDWDLQRPDRTVFSLIMAKSVNQIIWGGNYFVDYLYPSMGWLVWDKGQRNFSLADGELAWTSYSKALRIYTVSRGEALQDGKQHPTQKSLEIMHFSILYAGDAKIILDPFMGSGTTLRAAKDLGRKAIGIEIEEKYCEIAAKRMSQAVLL